MDRGGEGWGEWERQRTLPLLPVSFTFPTPFPFTPATWAKTGHTFQVSCVLLATQIPRHCTLLMPIQEECICDFYFQCVDLWWYITARGSNIKLSEQQLCSLALQPGEVEFSRMAHLCPWSICIFSSLLYLPWELLKQGDLPGKNRIIIAKLHFLL